MSGQYPFAKDRIDPSSYVPLYVQLFQILRNAIETGIYNGGDKLPSERELTEEFDVSRITVTKAIEELVRTGKAYRLQGKGTFVVKHKIKGLSSFGSFTTDILQRGMTPSSKLISLDTLVPDEEIRKYLELLPNDICYKLIRVRNADSEPVAVETAFLPVKLFPDLEKIDLEIGSLYETMAQYYNLHPAWSEGIFEAAPASNKEAALLEISQGDPVLWIHRITMDKNYLPLEWVHSMYRSDRFSFSTGRQPVT